MRTGPQKFSATTVISYVLTLVLWAYHPSSFGDQTDIRLPNLFDELTDASNRLDAKIIEQKIWVIWHTGPDPEVDEWFNQAQAAASSGDSLRALQIFKSVTSKYPRYAEGWNQRAIMHYLMGDIEDSLKTIGKTLELEPRHF